MSDPLLHTTTLEAHSEARNDAVRSIEVRVSRLQSGALMMSYVLDADLDCLRIPRLHLPRIGDRLWQHTCFEFFVKRKDGPAYYEFNFSPSGEWAAYAFERYREAAALGQKALKPSISVRKTATKLELDVALDLHGLSSRHAAQALTLAISAVIEAGDGSLSYWALRHPAGKPDFHHSDAFVLELDEIRD
ncbi:MAG: hypothetical protein V7640_2918 [Betaproteobacteria bacterium]